MLNRLQHYPPPPNLKPSNRSFPVLAAEEKPLLVDFTPARQDVAIRAYYIFLNEGARHGSDVRHWLEAELQLMAEHQAA